jgi:hypothetical protein
MSHPSRTERWVLAEDMKGQINKRSCRSTRVEVILEATKAEKYEND